MGSSKFFFFPSSNLDVSSDFASGKHRAHRAGILGKHRDFRKHKWTRFSENSDIFGNTSRFSKTHRDSRKTSRFLETHRDSRKHIVILGNASRFSENIDIFGTTKLTACLGISNQMYSVQYQNVYAHKTYPWNIHVRKLRQRRAKAENVSPASLRSCLIRLSFHIAWYLSLLCALFIPDKCWNRHKKLARILLQNFLPTRIDNENVYSKVISFYREALSSVSKWTLDIHFETKKKGFIDNRITKITRWCDINSNAIIIKFLPLQKRSHLISRFLQEEQKAR